MENRKRKRSSELITSQDIIFEILLRLPARSLIRFKTTCKLWNSIISDDANFAVLHCRTWIQKLRLVFQTWTIRVRPDKIPWDLWICKFKENETEMDKLRSLPFKCVGNPSYPVDSSDSLLLFREDNKSEVPKYSVCDCASSNQIVLPSLPSDVDFVSNEFLVYDASTNMYKVLVYTMDVNGLRADFCYITSFHTKPLVRENGWRTIDLPFAELSFCESNVAIRGILYLLAYGVKDNKTILIQPFDIADEKFLNTIRLPDKTFIYASSVTSYLREVRGSLGFMFTTRFKFEIWVLKDSSCNLWIMLHKICPQSIFGSLITFPCVPQCVFILQNLKILPSIILRIGNEYFWYEMNGEKVKKIDLYNHPAYDYCLAAWFSQSLCL